MNYQNALSEKGSRLINYAFAHLLEGVVFENRAEMLDTLLDCQAGQAHAAMLFLDERGIPYEDKQLFVSIAPAAWIETELDENRWRMLTVYADRSVLFTESNENPEIWLDIEDFIDAYPKFFSGTGLPLPCFCDITCYLSSIPERFAEKTDADYLNAEHVRAALMTGTVFQFQVFNNRLAVQNYGDDFYKDVGAVHDDIFVEEVCYELRLEHAAYLETQAV